MAMTTALSIAQTYIARGWAPVPIPFRAKVPVDNGWQLRRIDRTTVANHFNGAPQNISVALGPQSNGLTDVDLDCPEAAAIAPYLLPRTGAIFGRASSRASHWLYTTDLAAKIDKAAIAFDDPDAKRLNRKARLLEIRIGGGGKGAQTVFPGSVHEEGEPIEWEENGEPAAVDGADLLRRVRLIAAASLIARNWPAEGGRHKAALTVGGFLARAGLSETDIATIVQAIARAACDEEWKDRVRAAKDQAAYHLQGNDVRGLPMLAELVGEAAANRIADWLEYSSARELRLFSGAGIPATVPVQVADAPPTRQWPELPEQALHGLAGDVVTALAPHTESDPAALLLQYLVSFGSAIGRGPYYQVEADKHFTNLFVVLVGQSSKSRKGTSAGRIRAIHKIADDDWASRCAQGGMSSGEGVIWAIRDPITTIKKGEEVTDDLGVSDKRLLLDEREFYSALAVMKREGNILSRVIRDAWDSREFITSMTKHSKASVTNPHIAVSAHITEDEFRRSLDHTSMANGYANRFLIGCVRRARLLPHGGATDHDTTHRLGQATSLALQHARRLNRVTMTAAAAEAWSSIYEGLSEGGHGLLGAITGRAEAQTIRLAMIYALLDNRDRIDMAHLEAAVSVWDYCAASAAYVFGDTVGDPVADDILRTIRNAGDEGVTRNQLRDLFGRHQSSATIGAALGTLAAAGKITSIKRSTGGRSAEVWIAGRSA
jgi:Bifunctional DNA primase/polymerase, N-terminal/Protein of unknown function (DUF3987)